MRRTVLLLILSCSAGSARADENGHASLDLYFFGQRDQPLTQTDPTKNGGNPLRSEGFDYDAVGLELRQKVSDRVAFQGSATLGWIQDDGEPHPVPEELVRGFVVSASPELLTLDSTAGVEVKTGGWTIGVSGFYHHQKGFFVGGPNIDLRTTLNDDTSLFATFNYRFGLDQQRDFRGRFNGRRFQQTGSALLGWGQVWSRDWLTVVSFQLAEQSGYLGNRFNYVALYEDGRAVKLVEENVPTQRLRAQVNARARYSPLVGVSLGLDSSLYLDTWGVQHASLQPSVEVPLGDARLRLWYRASAQEKADFSDDQASEALRFFTQDSDLASFIMHSPGALITMPLGARDPRAPVRWELRLSAYGFYRSDELWAVGTDGGLLLSW